MYIFSFYILSFCIPKKRMSYDILPRIRWHILICTLFSCMIGDNYYFFFRIYSKLKSNGLDEKVYKLYIYKNIKFTIQYLTNLPINIQIEQKLQRYA